MPTKPFAKQHRTIGAVILAAGAGTRMGGVAKALIKTRGDRTFLQNILARAREAGLDDAIVVVGAPHGDEVAAHARELAARVVVNPDPSRGMASSVALGFAALGDLDAAWLWPVDHPDVEVATLRTLLTALAHYDGARPVHDGRGGHPPLIAEKLFRKLAACAATEGGARTVLAAADVIDVNVPDPGCVRDVDTQIDLEPV